LNIDLQPFAGVVVNIAIGCTVVEASALLAIHYVAERGPQPGTYLPNLISGFFLMLALRAALGSAWGMLILCLMVSGTVHASDMMLRFRRDNQGKRAAGAMGREP